MLRTLLIAMILSRFADVARRGRLDDPLLARRILNVFARAVDAKRGHLIEEVATQRIGA